jgi:AraC-like DNA-binding protein
VLPLGRWPTIRRAKKMQEASRTQARRSGLSKIVDITSNLLYRSPTGKVKLGASPGRSCTAHTRTGCGMLPIMHRERMKPEELIRLRRARDLMDRWYATPLDVPTMAQAALMSPSHFTRRFRLAYGETPYNYLMTRRIERAMALLRRGDLTVTEVCLAVGASSLGSFSARFTELVGQSPSAYQAAQRAAPAAAVPACVAKSWLRPKPSRGLSRIEEADARPGR